MQHFNENNATWLEETYQAGTWKLPGWKVVLEPGAGTWKLPA